MGVKGLWKILEPVGRPIHKPESLKGQRVAVDASIWVYQFLRVIDSPPLVLAGLLGRLGKLLYFGMLPVLVFDGAPPAVKKETTRERGRLRVVSEDRYKRLARKIIAAQLCQRVLQNNKDDDFDNLGREEENLDLQEESESEIEMVDEDYLSRVNVFSPDFAKLPIDMQQEILLAKKDYTQRQHLDSLKLNQDKDNNIEAIDFSNLQVEALVKRRRIAEQLERVREGTLDDFEGDCLRKNMDTSSSSISSRGKRIASDGDKRYALVKGKNGAWIIDGRQNSVHKKQETAMNKKDEVKKEDNEEDDFMFGVPDNGITNVGIEVLCKEIVKQDMKELTFHPEDYLIQSERKIETLKDDITNITSIDEQEEKEREQIPKPALEIIDLHHTDNVPVVPLVLEESLNDSKKESITPLEEPIIVLKEEEQYEPYSMEEGIEEEYISEEIVAPILENIDNSLLIAQLQQEIETLRSEAKTTSNLSSTPSTELLEDFRTMLTIMGIPWIIAPSEAEAQCAYMQSCGQVDVIVTDDNDVFLFGGSKVVRHLFGKQNITLYDIVDVKRELQLERTDLIVLALLLGSDYFIGVRGMGPVKSLQLLKTVSYAKDDISALVDMIRKGLVHGQWPIEDPFLQKLSIQCATSTNATFSGEAIDAYLHPLIDTTPLNLTWHRILHDHTSFNTFAMSKLRWTSSQCSQFLTLHKPSRLN